MLFGASGKYRDNDERKAVAEAYRDYFKASGIGDIPPGVALAIALSIYALPRAMEPEPRNRIKEAAIRFARWIKGLRK